MRVKRGFQRRRFHKKILKRAKGFQSAGSRSFTVALERSDRALAFQYRDRKRFKNDIKKLWIHRISTAVSHISYSRFMALLKRKNILLNRKTLSLLALENPKAFASWAKKL